MLKAQPRHALPGIFALLLCMVLIVSTLATLTFAWQDFTQHSLNQFNALLYKDCSALLSKYETGKDGEEGRPKVTVAGAEFYLYKIQEDLSETQIGERYTTNAEGQLVVHSLAPGGYVFVETAPPYGWDYPLDEDNQPITRYPFTVGGDAGVHVQVKAFNDPMPQTLLVTKTVQNQSGRPVIEDQKQIDFLFTIHFSDGGTYECSIADGAPVPIASGGTFTLRHEQTAIFTGIPVGVQYTISEAPMEDYCTTSENSQGHITKEGAEAHFTNTYQDVGGAIFIRKTVSGNLANPEDTFTFTVTFEDGGTYYYVVDNGPAQSLASGGTLTLKGGQTATFGKLPLGLRFTVQETGMPDGYQPTVHTVTGQATQVGSEALFYNIHQEESDEPGSLSITKLLAGTEAEPEKEFAFTVTFSDGGSYDYSMDGTVYPFASGETILLKGGQTALFEGLPKGLGYLVEEADYSVDGYISSAQKTEGTIVALQTAALSFTNEKNPEPEFVDPVLRVRKQVNGPATDKEFEFTVKLDHEESNTHTVETFTLKDGETKEFHCFSGTRYEVSEKNYFPDGYIETTTHASGVLVGDETTVVEAVFTNTWYLPEMMIISGEKTWDTSANPNIPLPEYITLRLKDGDTVEAEQKVYPGADGRWAYSFEVPKTAPDGREIAYTLEEIPVPGFYPILSQEGNTINITNTAYAPVVLESLGAKKLITGENIPADSQFQFILTGLEGAPMPEGSANGQKTITVTGQGTGSFGSIQFNHPGIYRYQMQEVNGGLAGYTYDPAVYSITITVTDTDGLLTAEPPVIQKDGAETAANPPELEFTNQYQQTVIAPISIHVRKIVVSSPTNPHPDYAKVQLYHNGVAVGEIVYLNDANNWQHTWHDLDPEGVWTVDEIDVPPGYIKEIEGSAEEGFVITDRFDPNYEKTIVEGEKRWNHGDNPPENRPVEILVQVKTGDFVVAQKQVSAADGWKWRFELPKIDSEGHEIQYTIEELPVPGYTSNVEGWNITNTYNSNHLFDPILTPGGQSPQTNDPIQLWLWAGIFVAAAAGLIGLYAYRRHRKIKKRTREVQAKLVYRRKK